MAAFRPPDRPAATAPRPRETQERANLGIVGMVLGITGVFVVPILFGPAALICGWLALHGRWPGAAPVPVLMALVLGTINTVLAVFLIAGGRPGGAFL